MLKSDEELSKIHARIEMQVPYVGVKPFSHNIISMWLGYIAKEFGEDQANEAIDKFDLESLGWAKINEEVQSA